MADPIRNFFSSTLVGTYSDTDTSLTIATSAGDKLPDPSVDGEFNLVIYNESEIGVVTTFDGGSTDTRQDLGGTKPEIVRVTAKSGDVLTVIRGQEGTSASAKEAGNTYRVILSATKKVFDDIQTAIDNVNLTNLSNVESITYDNTGDEVFQFPVGTTAQRPLNPQTGYLRFNTDDARVEYYNGSRWAGFSEVAFQSAELGVATASATSQEMALSIIDDFIIGQAIASANDASLSIGLPMGVADATSTQNDLSLSIVTPETTTANATASANDAEIPLAFDVEYLVIAGGGRARTGGGGAGGYRSSVIGEQSGRNTSAESVVLAEAGDSFTVTVGGSRGNSTFGSITSTRGGDGGGYTLSYSSSILFGGDGGSGGGGGGNSNPDRLTETGTSCQSHSLPQGGDGTSAQGFDGGRGVWAGSSFKFIESGQQCSAGKDGLGGGGAGGGAGSAGQGNNDFSGIWSPYSGGNGKSSSITGSSVTRARGGDAASSTTATGASNTGNGGTGARNNSNNTYINGGSGIVILRYTSDRSISVGGGLSASTTTVGDKKVTTFTSGSGTITFT